ncbi:MAG TPA: protein phosphatase 2C domain-containing protein [Thermoanaerobaculia bacterium]|nr:protein phosphatase 2C domain-containing protein [Thermoanaerobaculia bacterium]
MARAIGQQGTVSPLVPLRRLAAASASDPGRERDGNEDRVLCDPERGIFAVIDGVGGESGGEVAAQIALDTLRGRLSRRTTDAERLVREAIAQANKQIFDRAQAERGLAGMACVLTVAVLDGPQVTVGHVGDSRMYLLRKGEIRKVTRDHSPVGSREDAGELSEADAMRHPRRNEIFRDVGSGPHQPDDPEFIETYRLDLDPESALLICSDGLSDMVASRDILAIAERHAGNPSAMVDELIDAANAAGGKDNVSVVVAEGERFAASIRPVPPPAAITSIRGAASAKPEGMARWRGPLTGVLALLLILALGWFFREPLLRLYQGWRGGGTSAGGGATAPASGSVVAGDVIRVGPGEGELRSITEALAAAQPGQTVMVAPGEYTGPFEMRDGVSLVSATPRGAVLRAPQVVAPAAGTGQAPVDPVVLAVNVRGARLAGFRIAGTPEAAMAVGLRLVDSELEVEDLEVMGATVAAVEVSGGGQSTFRFNSIHGNPGAGVVLTGGASPRMLQNLIAENGTAPRQPRPALEIGPGSRPSLIENRILRNGSGGSPQVRVAEAESVAEIYNWNDFGGVSRGRAIQVRPATSQTTQNTGRGR